MWVDVIAAANFPIGAKKLYETDFEDVLVLHLETGLYAIENRCSHDHVAMDTGHVDDGAWVCPFHGAHFCLRSGKALTPPAYEDIDVYAVRVEAGVVQLEIDV